MHIAFFNRSFYPEIAATSQLLTELCEDLVHQHGCRVSVVAGLPLRQSNGNAERAVPPILARERYRGIEILRASGTRFSKRRFLGRFSNYVSYFLSACYAGLRLDRPDIVVALTDPPIIGLAGYLASRRFGAGFVMSYRDIFPEAAYLLEDFRSKTVDRALQRVNCFLVRKADRVVALGETMRQRLIEGKGADPVRVVIIPDWADCFEINPGPKRNQFSLGHGLAEKFVVMHSGNIGLAQGLETVVDAAAHLRDFRNIEFVFVGDGVKRLQLEAQAQALDLPNVRFLPYQPKDQLTESFATADVFVISLKHRLTGYIVPSKLYGILAAGRPYIAAVETDCEVATVTRKHDCGLLTEPGKPEELADAILNLYHDRSLALRLGANARLAALEFDRAKQVRAYYELLREISCEHRRGAVVSVNFSKRSFDVLLSAIGLIFSLPLWGLIALAVRLSDGGPVFYRQERVGQAGRRFVSWKFRSMVPGADEMFGPLQAKEGDSRITSVGRALRATAMDELPQLWNILRGDMSFVGPRALLPEEIEVNGDGQVVPLKEIPGYVARHRVPPGLTGLAQIYAPRDIPRKHKFRLDLLYIRKQNLWLDLKIVATSFWITFRGKWESRGRKV